VDSVDNGIGDHDGFQVDRKEELPCRNCYEISYLYCLTGESVDCTVIQNLLPSRESAITEHDHWQIMDCIIAILEQQ
jgi:hypothetical protein